MSTSNHTDVTTIILLIIGAIIVLPFLTMGFGGMMGYGGMMGGFGPTGGMFPFFGLLVPLFFLILLISGGYLLVRNGTESQPSKDTAIEELRRAYARGELTDEEFETRKERLKRSK